MMPYKHESNLEERLKTHYLRKSQTKFTKDQISVYSSLAVCLPSELDDKILEHLISNQDTHPYHFLRLFRQWLVYLNCNDLDPQELILQVQKLVQEWESLKAMKEFYLRIVREENAYKYEKIYEFFNTCNLNLSKRSSDNCKHQVIMCISKQYGKNSTWCISIVKELDLKLTLTEVKENRGQAWAKLKYLFVECLKSNQKEHIQSQTVIDQLRWLSLHVKATQTDNDQDYSSLLQEWNHYSGQPINIVQFQKFYLYVLERVMLEQMLITNLKSDTIEFLKKNQKLHLSVMANCLALFVQIYRRSSLNCQFMKKIFGLVNTLDIWKTTSNIIVSEILDIPDVLKGHFFKYQKELLLFTIKISDYLAFKALRLSQPSDTVLQAFVDRVDEFLVYRFYEIDRKMGTSFRSFYHKSIQNLTSSNVQLAEASFDHIIVFCVYYGCHALGLNPDIELVHIVRFYTQLDSRMYSFIEIDGKSIIDVYNNCFIKFVSSTNSLQSQGACPQIRGDFLAILKDSSENANDATR